MADKTLIRNTRFLGFLGSQSVRCWGLAVEQTREFCLAGDSAIRMAILTGDFQRAYELAMSAIGTS